MPSPSVSFGGSTAGIITVFGAACIFGFEMVSVIPNE